jgi:hypothetical protein
MSASNVSPLPDDEDVSQRKPPCLSPAFAEPSHAYTALQKLSRAAKQVVDAVIRRSGCEEKYRAMENCLAFETNRDFKACAAVCAEGDSVSSL